MILVDIFGIPGVGKTTHVNNLQNNFTGQVYKREHVFLSKYWTNPIYKILTVSKAALLYLRLRLFNYTIKNNFSSKNNYFKECIYIILVVNFIKLHKTSSDENALLLDHGFAQVLVHLMSTSTISEERKEKLIESIIYLIPNTKVLFVYIENNNLELVVGRLTSRTKNRAWFDHKEKTFIYDMLNSYANCSVFLHKHLLNNKNPNFRFELKFN